MNQKGERTEQEKPVRKSLQQSDDYVFFPKKTENLLTSCMTGGGERQASIRALAWVDGGEVIT